MVVSSKTAPDWAKYTKIIICDDHIAVRTGLKAILEEEQIVVVETCSSIPALTSAVSKHPDAIVITDLGIGDLTIKELANAIHQQSSECRIIAYSMRETPSTIAVCYEAGALAFVPKGADPDVIIKAIEAATFGKKYYPPGVAEKLVNLHEDKNNPRNILSARELEILLCYAEYSTVEAMVTKLNLTEKSTRNALSTISRKLKTPRSMFEKVVRQYGLEDLKK